MNLLTLSRSTPLSYYQLLTVTLRVPWIYMYTVYPMSSITLLSITVEYNASCHLQNILILTNWLQYVWHTWLRIRFSSDPFDFSGSGSWFGYSTENLTVQKVRKPGLKFFLRLEYSGKSWKLPPFSMRKPVSYGSYFLKWIIKHAKRNFTKWSWAHVLSPNMDVSDLCKYWIYVCANVSKKWFNFYSEAPEFTSSWFQIFFSVKKHAGI